MNDRPAPHRDLMAFAAICSEAARCCGDDWAAVEQHIRARVFDLPEAQRQSLVDQMDRVLRYRAPRAGAKTQ